MVPLICRGRASPFSRVFAGRVYPNLVLIDFEIKVHDDWWWENLQERDKILGLHFVPLNFFFRGKLWCLNPPSRSRWKFS